LAARPFSSRPLVATFLSRLLPARLVKASGRDEQTRASAQLPLWKSGSREPPVHNGSLAARLSESRLGATNPEFPAIQAIQPCSITVLPLTGVVGALSGPGFVYPSSKDQNECSPISVF
jgi:hypothetical protein